MATYCSGPFFEGLRHAFFLLMTPLVWWAVVEGLWLACPPRLETERTREAPHLHHYATTRLRLSRSKQAGLGPGLLPISRDRVSESLSAMEHNLKPNPEQVQLPEWREKAGAAGYLTCVHLCLVYCLGYEGQTLHTAYVRRLFWALGVQGAAFMCFYLCVETDENGESLMSRSLDGMKKWIEERRPRLQEVDHPDFVRVDATVSLSELNGGYRNDEGASHRRSAHGEGDEVHVWSDRTGDESVWEVVGMETGVMDGLRSRGGDQATVS